MNMQTTAELSRLNRQIIEVIAQARQSVNSAMVTGYLRYMRRFFQAFPIRHAVRGELGWTHFRSERACLMIPSRHA